MLDFEFGKYAVYIWASFGLTALVFAGMIAASLAHARRWRKLAESRGRK